MIGPTNYRAKRSYSRCSRCVICVHNNALISTLVTTCIQENNEVESRYLQEKVTSLQVESST